MGFWSRLLGGDSTITDNGQGTPPPTVGPSYSPGDPEGVVVESEDIESRSLPSVFASPWSGWPAEWATPALSSRASCLVDTAWACLDKNSSVLSTMPVYKTRDGQVGEPEPWMLNPDPKVYTSWAEFAKQLFWDYQTGEAFVQATDYFSTGYPMFMRVLPPWMVKVEMEGAQRRYFLGSVEITADVLHIRYKSSLDCARGIGPLEAGGARMTAAGVLARYMATMVSAPPPYLTLETDELLNQTDAQRILDQWVESRQTNLGYPAVLDGGVKLQTHQMNARDMALLELAQFNESRICVLLGVPPFLMALPSGGDSMTYSNVEQLFDFHDRSCLRPMATTVMSALSNWALGPGRAVELDRDEYTRPSLAERVNAWVALHGIDAITSEQIQAIERQLFTTSSHVSRPLGGGA
ncbi:MAG TPA: phage portal protein [Ilumatobacteraceae bacterium]